LLYFVLLAFWVVFSVISCLSVAISQVIGCEHCLWNELDRVGRALNSIPTTTAPYQQA